MNAPVIRTIKDFQADFAELSAKVKKQEEALSPDAIATAAVGDLAAANGEILADVRALREKIETNTMSLPDGRQILKHEYEALQQLARENGIVEERVLEKLNHAEIEGGQIKTIDLSSLGLSTVTALEALSGLVKLFLHDNGLKGDPQFPALPKLETLGLFLNHIAGVSGLSRLRELTKLDLSYNDLKGDPQFPALPKLQMLKLHVNMTTGASGLSRLPALTELSLHGNALKGDPQFPDLPKLQTLELSRNEITGVSGLSTLTGLKTLIVDAKLKTKLKADLEELVQRGLTLI